MAEKLELEASVAGVLASPSAIAELPEKMRMGKRTSVSPRA